MKNALRYLRLVRFLPPEIGWWKTVQLELIDKVTRMLGYAGFHPRWPVTLVKVRGVGPRLHLRMGTSDYYALKQIFGWHYYLPAELLSSATQIIDAGANAGYFSVLMLEKYPQARVVAAEPEPGNFKICSANLASYGARASVMQVGVWSHEAQLSVTGSGWSAEVKETLIADPANVRAVDIPCLMQAVGGGPIDVMKIDIEGSELRVFANPPWMTSIRNIAIELHGADCERTFFGALAPFQYELTHKGDATFCMGLARRTGEEPQRGDVKSINASS